MSSSAHWTSSDVNSPSCAISASSDGRSLAASGRTSGGGEGDGELKDGPEVAGVPGVRSMRSIRALGGPRDRRQAHPLDERGVVEPGEAGGAAEAGAVGEIAVGVDVDDVGHVVRAEAHVD